MPLAVLALTGVGLLALWLIRTPSALFAAELQGMAAVGTVPPAPAWGSTELVVSGLLLAALGGLLGGRVFGPEPARAVASASATALLLLAGVSLIHASLVERLVACEAGGCESLRSYTIWVQGTAFLLYSLSPPAVAVAGLGAVVTLARASRNGGLRDALQLAKTAVNSTAEVTGRTVRNVLASPRTVTKRVSHPRRAGQPRPVANDQPATDHERDSTPIPAGSAVDGQLPTVDAGSGVDGGLEHWRCASRLPVGRSRGGLGICLSGGGIRSATFAVGALQALQEHAPLPERPDRGADPQAARPWSSPANELTRARYLTAVSGGAYAAGAFLLALPHKGGCPTAPPLQKRARAGLSSARDWAPAGSTADLFQPGAPEFDHLRRHASYLADGAREWAVAVLTVLRGMLISIVFLAWLAVVAGRWVGHVYAASGRTGDFDGPWRPIWGMVAVTVLLTVVAAALWGLSIMTADDGAALGTEPSWPRRWVRRASEALRELADRLPGRRRPPAKDGPSTGARLRRGAGELTAAVAVLVTVGAVIPFVIWLSHRLVNLPGPAQPATAAGTTARGGLVVLSGLVVSAVGLWSSRRKEITAVVSRSRRGLGTWLSRFGDVGRRATQWLAVYGGLAVVVLAYLVVFGRSAAAAASESAGRRPVIRWGEPEIVLSLTNLELTALMTVLLLAAYWLVDETTLGLHPFYRRRLASAFAVRRWRYRDRDGDVKHRAVEYEWDEVTRLDTFGKPVVSFPHVVFCASAHVSDSDRTPPGRHVLPFTLSHDAVGGPDFGWFETADLLARPSPTSRDHISGRLKLDLTVETAMAVSGAAFASAMGRYRQPGNVILALANARLGTWMPNVEVLLDRRNGELWWQTPIPRRRRLSYMLREIFGRYSAQNPLLFVTDGGHYENLGLVELLRHRCTEIYCIDASSDRETFAASIAQAITLAGEELGVRVSLDFPDQAAPHGGEGDTEAARLAARLADDPVISGRITYPDLGAGLGEQSGALVIGRAVLDPTAPWEVHRHAAANALFPYDATGDQWFDDAKFNAYTALGRHVGARAIRAMERLRCRPSDLQSVAASADRR